MNNINAVKCEHEHQQALQRLTQLMDLDPAENTAEFDEITVLASLIEEYEMKTFPIAKPSPAAAVRFRLEQN